MALSLVGSLELATHSLSLASPLEGKRGMTTGSESQELVSQQLVHTPGSLFARLRQALSERELVRTLDGSTTNLSKVSPGDFVEFPAMLRRSPVHTVLNSILSLLPLVDAFELEATPTGDGEARRGGGKGKGKQRQPVESRQQRGRIAQQIKAVLDAVTAEGSEDLIAECKGLRFVLTAERPFFVDSTMNDIIDGTFQVFGKATRVILDSDNSIGLMRKSSLGQFPNVIKDFARAFSEVPDLGFNEKVENEIRGPTMQVIPIAIFA